MWSPQPLRTTDSERILIGLPQLLAQLYLLGIFQMSGPLGTFNKPFPDLVTKLPLASSVSPWILYWVAFKVL